MSYISVSVFDRVKSTNPAHFAGTIHFDLFHEFIQNACGESTLIPEEYLQEAKLNDSTCYVAGICNTESGRGKAHTLSQSALVLDFDGDDSVDANTVIAELENLSIMAIAHESWSSNNNSRFRIIIPFGFEVIDPAFYVKAANFIISQLSFREYADECSFKWYQLMLPPQHHVYSPPNSWMIQGDPLLKFYDEIEQVKFETQWLQDAVNVFSKEVKSSRVSPQHLSEADKLFAMQASNLHKSVKFDSRVGDSLRFRRNRDDTGAGCYIMNDGRAIKDNRLGKDGRPVYKRVFYSPSEFQQAVSHKLEPWEEWADNTEGKIRELIGNQLNIGAVTNTHNFKAVIHTNAGCGKSRLMQRFAHDNPLKQRYIFTFHTKDNLNSFVRHCSSNGSELQVILGNEELVVNYREFSVEEKKAIKSAFGQLYANHAHEKVKRRGFKRVIKSLPFLSRDIDALMEAYQQNRDNIYQRDKHLVMTTAKFKSLIEYSFEKGLFLSDVIFQDEMTLGEFEDFESKSGATVWNQSWDMPTNDFPKYKQYVKRLRMCFLTAELAPVLELKHQGLKPEVICQPHHYLEPNLEVLLVPSTTNDPANPVRKYITQQAEQYFDEVIVDAAGSDVNHVNSKGRNNLKVKKLCVIVADPHPSRIAMTMTCTGLTEAEAHTLLMSDAANQGVGRNAGYRWQQGQQCLMIVPHRQWLSMHNVTPNVFSYDTWKAKSRTVSLPKKIKQRALFGDFYDNLNL